MILAAFTLFHVVISLAGIGTGLVVLYGLLKSNRFDRTTAVFLTTTAAASVTGFLFPFERFRRRLEGAWGKTYAIGAATALYLNIFVLIAQLFDKIPFLKVLAPTKSEPPFLVTQLIVLLAFIALGTLAGIRFQGTPLRMTADAR